MVKFINIIAALFLLVRAGSLYAQEDIKRAAAIADSIKQKGVRDTSKVKTLPAKPAASIKQASFLSDNAEGMIINRGALYLIDYKSIGDLFYQLPFGFQQSLGSPGMPDEAMLYGNGFGAVAYSDDGISINNRLFNFFDLGNFQSEKIDSIEVYSLPKAFLYSPLNENSAVNFIARDMTGEKQYSRLRFYEGPNKEGFIDFIFNMPIKKNLFFTSEITNNSVKDRYFNSEAGGWRASVKLRYNMSDRINFLLNYNYINTETRLNGGVNIDSLKIFYPDTWQTNLYSEQRAPVNYYNRGEKVLNHAVSFRMLADIIEGSRTDATLYYRYGLNEYRQNEPSEMIGYTLSPGADIIIDDNKYSALGARVNQGFLYGPVDLKFIFNYEKNRLNTPLLGGTKENNMLSLSAAAAMHLFDSTLTPSVYIKQMGYNSKGYFGAGADINLALEKSLYLYAGYSFYGKPYNVFEENGLAVSMGGIPAQNVTNFEAGVKYAGSNYNFRLSYFRTSNNNYAVPVFVKPDSVMDYSAGYYFTADKNTSGLNAMAEYRLWKILLTANATSYLSRNEYLVNSPAFTVDWGIYFTGILFNNNLDLKAGFNFKFYTGQNFFYYDFEKSVPAQLVRKTISGSDMPVPKTSDIFRIDFYMAGKVQDAAYVYFTFENLLDSQYFMVPYYPAMGRYFRLGISWEFLD